MLYLTCFRTLHAFVLGIAFVLSIVILKRIVETIGLYFLTTSQQYGLHLCLYHLCGGLYIYFFHIAMSSFFYFTTFLPFTITIPL